MGYPFISASMSTTLVSKSLALEFMSGIRSNGSFGFDVMMASQRNGPGMKIADPLKPTSPLVAGTGMSSTSWAVLHLESSSTVGTMMLQFASAKFKLMRMLTDWVPIPNMQTTLLWGQVRVPPKFLGKCRIIMHLCASAAKITVLISLIDCRSLVASLPFKFKILLKAFKFWFPASLLAWLTNQFDQVVCVPSLFTLLDSTL
jgi:hypothetical protein